MACSVQHAAASPGTLLGRFPEKFTGATSSSSEEDTPLSTHSGSQAAHSSVGIVLEVVAIPYI